MCPLGSESCPLERLRGACLTVVRQVESLDGLAASLTNEPEGPWMEMNTNVAVADGRLAMRGMVLVLTTEREVNLRRGQFNSQTTHSPKRSSSARLVQCR